MSQNVAFNETDKQHWHLWKQLKESGLTDDEIALNLRHSRQTITRLKRKAKGNGQYQKWMQDFLSRCHEEYWELHCKIKRNNPELAYVEIGRKIERSLIQRIETKEDIYGKIEFVAPWLNKFVSSKANTNHTQDNSNSTTIQQDSEFSHVEGDGEKTTAQSEKQ